MRLSILALSWTMLVGCLTSVASAQQSLRIGVPTGTAAWSFREPATGKDVGIVFHLVSEMVQDLGAVQFVPMPFGSLISGLTENKIDLIVANLTVTSERERVVSFSKPFFTGGDGLVVAKSDMTEYKTWDDLRGMPIGTFAGSIYVQPMKESGLFADVRTFTTPDDLVGAVDAGAVKAGVGPGVSLAYIVKQDSFKNMRLARSYQPRFKSDIAIGVRKDDSELLAKVNSSLTNLERTGKIKSIFARWGE
jgi:polar amino acid transport system substrate-binding protein